MIGVLLLEIVITTHYTAVAAISIHPTMIIKQPGQPLSIECRYSSSSNITVQWTLPNNIVRYSTERLLMLESVTSHDSGVYECSVSGESAITDVFIC